jgi:hypothetical protein
MKEIEAQSHLADQLYWQDISQCLNLDSADREDIATSWNSPGDFSNDGIHLKFDGKQPNSSLDKISEVLSAGSSRSYAAKLLLTASSVAELKIELLSAHTENDESDTSKVLRNSWKIWFVNSKRCLRSTQSYAPSTRNCWKTQNAGKQGLSV